MQLSVKYFYYNINTRLAI